MPSPGVAGSHTYPALRFAVLFVAGVILGHLCSIPLAAAAPAAIALLVPLLISGRRQTHASPSLVNHTWTPAAMIVTLGVLKIGSDRMPAPELPDSLSVNSVTMVGKVIDPPAQHDRLIRCTMETEGVVIAGRQIAFQTVVAVTIALNESDTVRSPLGYGMRLALYGRLSIPSRERNPGEFDPRQYYEANGISALFAVRGSTHVRVLESSGGGWLMRQVIVPARMTILRRIDETVGGEEGEFLKGLLLGERTGISAGTKRAFIDSGVAHVLAVSGSNVAVIAMILVFISDLVRLHRRIRAWVVAAGLLLYMALTGSQPPVVRATIMALVFLAGTVVQRRASAYNTLGLSALLILIYDARQLFDVGFQLSFGAVFSIIHFYPRVNAWVSLITVDTVWRRGCVWMLRLCAVSLVASMGTLPTTAAYFGRVSIIGILANIPVIPATGLSVILGAASIMTGLVCPWSEAAYGAVNSAILHWTLDIAHGAASLPFATVDTPRFSTLYALPYYAALGLAFHWRERGARRSFLVALLAGLNAVCIAPATGGTEAGVLRVSFIDVGQGDAVLIELPDGQTILIDGGPRTPTFDAGERTVVPFLKRRGISHIDLLVISHPHDDHLGGVPYIIGHVAVRRVVDSGQPVRSEIYSLYQRAIAECGCRTESAGVGTSLVGAGNARLYVLGPAPRFVHADTSGPPPNINNASIVMKLLFGSVSFLLPGDAEGESEEAIVFRFGRFLQSTVLKAGHHGSITSSTPQFLGTVRPDLVAVSVGLRNTFRHPTPRVIARYESAGATVVRTDREGALMLETDGTSVWHVDWR